MVKALKISVVNGQTPKRAGPSLDLAVVTPVAMQSMGVTPPDYIREYPAIPIQYSHIIKHSSLIRANANSLLGTGSSRAQLHFQKLCGKS